jgi:hypothetical protein
MFLAQILFASFFVERQFYLPLRYFREARFAAATVVNCIGEQRASLVQIIAGVQHAVDFHAVFGPFFNLVKITIVRAKGVVGFLVRSVVNTPDGGRARR